MTTVRFLGEIEKTGCLLQSRRHCKLLLVSACTSGVKSHTDVPHVLCKGIISISRRTQHFLKDKVTTINYHLMSYNSNQDIFP